MSEEAEVAAEEIQEIDREPADRVWYVHLISGEKIFTKMMKVEGGYYRMINPMIMNEVDAGDGNSMVGLFRLAQGTKHKIADYHEASVLCISRAAPCMEEYYDSSVMWSRMNTDDAFEKATKRATVQIKGSLDRMNRLQAGEFSGEAISEEEFKSMPVEGFA